MLKKYYKYTKKATKSTIKMSKFALKYQICFQKDF